mgnify:FL=1|jgi:ATP-dependent exoDNAse (exonuclease V) alpha subunit
MIYKNLTTNEGLLLLHDSNNIFLTGPPGSGKTWLTNQYINYCKRNMIKIAITASTGIASKLLNGTTVHAWSGINIINEKDSFEDILYRVKSKPKKVSAWRKVQVLIIDEISLLDLKTFSFLDMIGQNIRKNTSPFGGIKLLIVGDFFQLPPVNGTYVFNYQKWEEMFDYGINLIENHRSNDIKLNKILKTIRKGKLLTDSMIKRLEKRVSKKETYPILVPLRSMARKINNDKLGSNNKTEYKYKASYYYNEDKDYLKDLIQKQSPLEDELVLKIGCPVINLVNDHSRRLMNGQVGVIIDFINERPIVEFNNIPYIMDKHMWQKELNSDSDSIVSMEQYPLLLCYALTIHRSQGQTLSQASMVLDNNVWEKGQGYVALSRLQSLEGLHLLKFNPNIFKVDKTVKKYYKNWKEKK